MIEPNAAKISTTLDIATNKRMYRLRVISKPRSISQTINFWYPQETLNYAYSTSSDATQ